MKWYMALNEAGTKGDIALHTKLAILSARRHTQLDPKMLYIGERNDFTQWLERQGVEVIDQQLPYVDVIDKVVQEGRYTTATMGHWLRTSVCLVERQDATVLYSDIDVIFRREPSMQGCPSFFAAAPEFDQNSWNYFNAGVMLINVEGLRSDYPEFEEYIRSSILAKTYHFHDQIAYNVFYRGRWDHLDVNLNWKPYWGLNPEATMIHFHGPKIGAIEAIIRGTWNWETSHGKQIGSLLVEFLASYKYYVGLILNLTSGLSDEEIDRLHRLNVNLNAFRCDPARETDLSFTKFAMFPP